MTKIRQMLIKFASAMAALAVMVATFNINSTCLFMSYQPDVPEEFM